MERTQTQLQDCTPSQLIGLMFGFATLNVYDLNWWDEASVQLRSFDLDKFTTNNLRQIFIICSHNAVQGNQLLFRLESFPLNFQNHVRNAWRSSVRSQISDFHRQVVSLLKTMGLKNLTLEKRLKNGYVVDIYWEDQGYKVAIEVDGLFHWTANAPSRALGMTHVRNRVLEGSGFMVVSVPLYEWVKLETDKAKIECLNLLLQPVLQN
eukprot:TRINITY_DN28353_c0_g1_i1.p1 TRINITY_DN28353_c0_g1~~TRINITY_DN28353_c0_g1_i1.p1  ORF type:complete len:208 (+),score=4.17 TRINITY_DN28353_c0_g1_i1:3-626(+)